MSTWNSVTIGANVPPEGLPATDEFSLIDGTSWDRIGGREANRALPDGSFAFDEHNRPAIESRSPGISTQFTGRSKHRSDEIEAWILEWSAAHPGVNVEWSQEWDDEDSGREVLIYRDGALVREESSKGVMVPLDYEELLTRARTALAPRARTGRDRATQIESALRALVDGRQHPRE